MSLDYSRLCLYLLNWRGICGPTVGHATRQQQTTAENSCALCNSVLWWPGSEETEASEATDDNNNACFKRISHEL